ncbi:DUF1295-domain-containing protein [Pleurotus eryngii]|uniref:DUF1295-domain-containing protein n=1 Tax=Pleurotus eryngii TaxID=5323 RepID=A0A9P6DEN2_PLEER|nr:DUF1295-domain-containing protein [Pleurotus eryngii]
MDFVNAIPPEHRWPLHFCAFSSAMTFVLSVLMGNVSQVDRVWTFLPTIYTAYYALLPVRPTTLTATFKFWFLSPNVVPYKPEDIRLQLVEDYSPRALLMLGLVTLWMLRLSYNTYRRGLFSLTEEDYRWAVLRKKLHPVLFQIFNILFIAITQNFLLWLLGLPTAFAALQPHTPLGASDFALAFLALVTLTLEFTADNQQFAFQTYKHALLHKDTLAQTQWPGARLSWTEEDAKKGFVCRGLWAYSRHPNFACEQAFWVRLLFFPSVCDESWIITLFPILAPSAPPFLPSLATLPQLVPSLSSLTPFAPLLPAVCLSILFVSSTIFTESITAGKYPEAYREYKKRVAMFSPLGTVVGGVVGVLRENGSGSEGSGSGKSKTE